jgi:hypothetical protein
MGYSRQARPWSIYPILLFHFHFPYAVFPIFCFAFTFLLYSLHHFRMHFSFHDLSPFFWEWPQAKHLWGYSRHAQPQSINPILLFIFLFPSTLYFVLHSIFFFLLYTIVGYTFPLMIISILLRVPFPSFAFGERKQGQNLYSSLKSYTQNRHPICCPHNHVVILPLPYSNPCQSKRVWSVYNTTTKKIRRLMFQLLSISLAKIYIPYHSQH